MKQQWRKTRNKTALVCLTKEQAQRDEDCRVREQNVTMIINKILISEHEREEDGKHTFHAGCLRGQLPRTSDFHPPAHDQSRKVMCAHRNACLACAQISDFNCSTLITKAAQRGHAGREEEMKDGCRLLRAKSISW